MTCEELQDAFELYALGVLEEDERGEIDSHLARGCEACQSRLKEALALNSAMLASTPKSVPPAHLRRRVLASFGIERSGWGWLGAFAAALLLMITLWLSVQERRRETELAEARRQAIQTGLERDRLLQAMSFLNQPETKQVVFGAGQPQPPHGNIFVNPRSGVLLIGANFPTLPAGKTYEMWVIPAKTSSPRPAGLFQPAAQGSAMNILSGPYDSLYAVAVSIEPEGGSQTPTQVILVAPVSGA